MTEAQLYGVNIVFLYTHWQQLHFFCNTVAAYDRTGILVKGKKEKKNEEEEKRTF